MTIKHLVISGGGPIMIQLLGTIQHLEQNSFFDIKNIKSIYGTSSGAIVGILICLKFDWEIINDYIIKRPWQDVFPIKVHNVFDIYTKKGFFDIKTVEKCFKPLFAAKDINIDINLEDFYKLTDIELHLFSFEINEYKIEDISYLTHPKLSLMTAILMTISIPIIFTPVCVDNKCYIDGGLYCNYPLSYCIDSGKNPDEVLGFKNKYNNKKKIINYESTLLEFLLDLLFKILFSISTDNSQKKINNEIICDTECINFENFRTALSNIEVRKELFNFGIINAVNFLLNLKDSVQELS